jgi:hypothetical protein
MLKIVIHKTGTDRHCCVLEVDRKIPNAVKVKVPCYVPWRCLGEE